MWRWHCREEVAHHHAMLELAHWMGQRTASRVLLLPLVATALALDSLRLQRLLLAEDTAAGRMTRWRARQDGARFLLAVLPSLARLAARGAVAAWRRPTPVRPGTSAPATAPGPG
jgi:predicted metal-dependent hydrolase